MCHGRQIIYEQLHCISIALHSVSLTVNQGVNQGGSQGVAQRDICGSFTVFLVILQTLTSNLGIVAVRSKSSQQRWRHGQIRDIN